MNLYSNLFYSKQVSDLCDGATLVANMVQFETALAQAQAKYGIIPKEDAEAIKAYSDPSQIDLPLLQEQIALTANAAAPLVKQLTELVKRQAPQAAGYIHLGATSQDVVDTAVILQLKSFIDWLDAQLTLLENNIVQLTTRHRNTVMVARTLMQQARPITFGLKTANWLASIYYSHQRLLKAKKRVVRLQLGGAVGTRNDQILTTVRSEVARILDLKDGPSWHTQRESIAELASILGILTGSLGKIAKDIILMAQTEVGELQEPLVEGRGTSSTMPHKRNPVLSTIIMANAIRVPHLVATILSAMPQEHERAAGFWQAEWEPLYELLKLSAGAVEKVEELTKGLIVDEDRMQQNLELSQGLIYAENVALALAPKMGKKEAHHWVEKACLQALEEQRHLKKVIAEKGISLSPFELENLFNPLHSIGDSQQIIDEILKASRPTGNGSVD